MKEIILNDFKKRQSTLDSFRERLVNLIDILIKQNNLKVHQIVGRTKEIESLSKKIDRKQDKYSSLDEITDIVGLRIITYLESDVNTLYDLITKEFTVDPNNSIDKRNLAENQFGYRSLHLVVSFNPSRSNLTEYKKFDNLKCEVQIRSILQHAWAEIEHDLGYKSKSSIPHQYKRNFNRLAALLETADIEFDRLKKELNHYEEEVIELIKTEPQNVAIDQASITSFNMENEILIEARNMLTKTKKCTYSSTPTMFAGMIERFPMFGIYTIKDLEDSLKENKAQFFEFIKEFTKNHTYNNYINSIILFYYQHFLAAKTEDRQNVEEYFNFEGFKINNDGDAPGHFIKTYQVIKNRI